MSAGLMVAVAGPVYQQLLLQAGWLPAVVSEFMTVLQQLPHAVAQPAESAEAMARMPHCAHSSNSWPIQHFLFFCHLCIRKHWLEVMR
jgi:hypothetical protein